MPDYDLITILGPTASGKTPFAAALAHETEYRNYQCRLSSDLSGMDVGTGKDFADYTVDGHPIPYHLIDIADPGYKYNVFEYQRDFLDFLPNPSNKKAVCPFYVKGPVCIRNRY